MGKIFKYETSVTIGETDMFESLYFANLFRIQGTVRELFVRNCVINSKIQLSGGLFLVTRSAQCEFKKNFFLFDQILVHMTFIRLSRASCDIRFLFYEKHTGELHSEGKQKIIFLGEDRKICKVPVNFQSAIREYMEN